MSKFILSLSFIILSLCGSVLADAGTKGMQFLKLGADARGNSLSGAVIGSVKGLDSLYWNPAGLNGIKGMNAMATVFNWPGDMLYVYGAFGTVLPLGKIGASITFLNEGSLENINESIADLENLSSYDMAVCGSYALKIRKVQAGLALKMITQKIMGESSMGAVMDIGGQISLLPKNILKLGMVVRNVGFSSEYEMADMPMVFSLGGSYKMDLDKANDLFLMASADVGADSSVSLATEYVYNNTIFLRAGYRYELTGNSLGFPKGMSFGLGGFMAPLGLKGISMDVTWIPMADLGNSLQTTVNVRF